MSGGLTSSNDAPPHPGAVLRGRVLPDLRLTVPRAARESPGPRQARHRVLACEALVTPEMASCLSQPCDIPAGFRLELLPAHDLRYAQRALGDTLDRIPADALPDTFRTDILTRHGRTH
ncbi:hypothetical protein [Azospirillum endophyticum]